jgi:hypothetical protein
VMMLDLNVAFKVKPEFFHTKHMVHQITTTGLSITYTLLLQNA